MHGVTCYEGNVALFFAETADLVGVNVTLKEGDRAITARLTPEAWERLCDRYGGPMASIKCKTEADECGPAVVAAMKERIESLESSQRYMSEQRDRLAAEAVAAKKLAEERAPTFEQFEAIRKRRDELELQCTADRTAFLEARAAMAAAENRVKDLEAMMQPNTATNGRRAMKLDDEPQSGPGVRGL
jgi:uncharacterized protein YhaN